MPFSDSFPRWEKHLSWKIRHNKRNCIPRTSKALTVELNKVVPGQEWFVFAGLCAFCSMLFAE